MIDSGMGETQVNSFLTAMNVPQTSTSLLKRYEKIVGRQLEVVAKESCIESLELEKKMTVEAGDINENE